MQQTDYRPRLRYFPALPALVVTRGRFCFRFPVGSYGSTVWFHPDSTPAATLVRMERFQLSCPKALLSKSSVYSCSTTSAYKLGSGIHFELVAFVGNFHIPPGLRVMYTGGRSASRTHQQLFCRQSLSRLGFRPWCDQPVSNRP